MTRFTAIVAATIGANFLLAAAVITRGDRTELAPVSHSPAANASAVSTKAPIVVTFPRPLDGRSVRSRFRLEPAADGALEVAGQTITFTPQPALAPDTAYMVTIAAGVQATTGRTSGQDYRFRFRTRRAQLLALRSAGAQDALWLVPADGGEAREVLREGQGAHSFALSPEGDRVAYIVPEGPRASSLWMASLPSGQRRRLALEEGVVIQSIAFSPKGDLIAYERRQVSEEIVERLGLAQMPQRLQIGLMKADGTPLGLIYGRGDEVGMMPTWSPDGARLAFYEPRYKAIAIFDFTRALSTLPWQGGSLGAWSPRGDRLVYTELVTDAHGRVRSAIGIASVAGGPPISVTEEPYSDNYPSWSPDGAKIAFVRQGPGTAGVWLADPATPKKAPLVADAGWVYSQPAWSPEGRQLAFSRQAPASPQEPPEMWVINPDGTNPRRLAQHGALVAWVP